MNGSDLAAKFGVKQKNIAWHLKTLSDEGFIRKGVDGGLRPPWCLGPRPAAEYQSGRAPSALANVQAANTRSVKQSIEKRDARKRSPVEIDRERLARDVEKFMATGGQIQDLGGYTEGPSRMAARAMGSDLL